MTPEELIERITAEVLKQLRSTADGSAAPTPEAVPVAAPPPGPRLLLLFTGGDQGLDEAVATAMELAAAGAQLKLLFTGTARTILGPTRLERLASTGELLEEVSELTVYQAVHWAEIVGVPILTQNTAVKAALGIRDSMASNLLASAIMMGRKVLVCPDSAVPQSAPARYRAMLTGYLDQLKTFGVATVPLSGFVEACVKRSPRPTTRPAQSAAPSSAPESPPPRRLVTAADVEAAVRNGQRQFPLPPGAIVTPLARDLCRERNIALVQQADGREVDALS